MVADGLLPAHGRRGRLTVIQGAAGTDLALIDHRSSSSRQAQFLLKNSQARSRDPLLLRSHLFLSLQIVDLEFTRQHRCLGLLARLQVVVRVRLVAHQHRLERWTAVALLEREWPIDILTACWTRFPPDHVADRLLRRSGASLLVQLGMSFLVYFVGAVAVVAGRRIVILRHIIMVVHRLNLPMRRLQL